jgi:hypothetical protein
MNGPVKFMELVASSSWTCVARGGGGGGGEGLTMMWMEQWRERGEKEIGTSPFSQDTVIISNVQQPNTILS